MKRDWYLNSKINKDNFEFTLKQSMNILKNKNNYKYLLIVILFFNIIYFLWL